MKKMFVACFAGLLSLPVQAQISIFSDDVVVTATRTPQSRASVLADTSVLTREDIERGGQSTLVELLRTLPGVEIESSGGMGQTSAIHLRGTGSQAVVVLLDGVRVGSATVGMTTLEAIPPEQIERIEVIRGPASSLYGADAIGGVIQLFTRHGEEGAPRFNASAGYGTRNTWQLGAGFSGATAATRLALNVSRMESDGISAKRIKSGAGSDRDAYENLSATGALSHQFSPDHALELQIYQSFNRADFDDDYRFPARQRVIQRGISLTSRNRFLPNWESKLQLAEGEDAQASYGSSFDRDVNRTYQRQYSWQNDLTLPQQLGLLTLAYDRREEHVVAMTTFTRQTRDNNGWLASYLYDRGDHTLQAGWRLDDNSQFGQHQTGNLGYGYRLNPNWRLSGSYGTAFRAPTFNDLYYPFVDYSYVDPTYGPVHYTYRGNANLKPETSRNREIALVFDQGHHRASATAYYNEIRNLIVGAQGLPDDFPTNIGSATIKGLTLTYEGWFDRFHVRGSGDFQHPENDDTGKRLVRRAAQHTALWVGHTWGDLELGTELIASGNRYNDAANQIKLGGYTLVNLTAHYRLNQDWSVQARVNNLFDREYALSTTANSYSPDAPAFGTPGTDAFITLRWQPQ